MCRLEWQGLVVAVEKTLRLSTSWDSLLPSPSSGDCGDANPFSWRTWTLSSLLLPELQCPQCHPNYLGPADPFASDASHRVSPSQTTFPVAPSTHPSHQLLAWLFPTWDSPKPMMLLPTSHRNATQLHPFSSQGETSCIIIVLPAPTPLSSLLALVAQMPSELLRVSSGLEPRRSLSHSCNLIPFYQRPLGSMESSISSQHESVHGMQMQCSI